MRGFFFGLVWGSIVIAVVAAMVSLLAPLPSGPDVRSNTPRGSSQSAEPGADSGVGRAGVDADLVNAAPTLPGTSDTADNLASMKGADTDSGARPVVGGDSTLTDPADGDTTLVETGTATTQPAATATPGAPGQGTGAPDDLGSVAQAPASAPEIDSNAGTLTGPIGSETGANLEVNSDTPVATSVQGTAPSAPQGETQLALSTEPAQPVVPTVSEGGSGFGTDAPTEKTVDPAANDVAAESTEPQKTALPQAGSDESSNGPSIGTPVVPLTERNSAPVESSEAATVPPIVMYSEPFSNPDNKPMMSIILIDDDASIGVEALANFPQPLTMAIDPSAPDAAEKMARHRAAGFEVVSLIDLPKGATAQDAEVTLAASFAAMPQVVAVLEGPNSGIQGNRSLADQVSAIVDSTGHGLVMQDNGLNTVFKLAARAGIPAGVVFRDFDGAGQSGAVIRRFLDQAAFRAGQDGAVIMLGRVRPDTVSALLLWALQDRASRVALAPISAVLNSDEAQ
ncbi:MAG: polysaccharide deacetylase 2 family uncharacterized protein YibQ [Paracoccaceae bacterium]|jgi:polysaccharide deacetylase 2 family uncharacterized protein YibQ